MPNPTPTRTPVTPDITPGVNPYESPEKVLYPDEICPQQKREHAAPEVEP